MDLGNGSEVIYVPRFVGLDRAWRWFEYLDKEIPWAPPSIRVSGRSCLQPRDTRCVASEGLSDLKYSKYQLLLGGSPSANILSAVHEALPGSSFNSLLLNRYNSSLDYGTWHSDDEKLHGATLQIASVSLGCEQKFQLRKKPNKMQQATKCAEASAMKRQNRSHPDQHSFILKHGSMLVMKGYIQ